MNPNSRGNYPPGYGPPNLSSYANQNAPVYDYSSSQYYYPQPQPWPTPSPNGGWQPQGYQQPHGTPDPNEAWQPQVPQPLNRDQQRAAARKVQEDPPLAQDPAWENPSLVIYLKDRSERGLTRNARGLGRRLQSQLSPPSAQYFPPPMMPQFPSYASFPPPPPPSQPPRSAPASSPDTLTLAKLEGFTKLAQNLMNLAPASGNNGRGRKKFAIKAASNAKVKDRSQSPKRQTETETYCERSPLRTSNVKLADRMSRSGLKLSSVKADDDSGISDNDVEPLLKVEDVLSNLDNAPGDAASAVKTSRKTILNRKNRARAKAKRHAAKVKDRNQSPKAQTETKTYRERSPLHTPHIKLEDPTS
ncbi:hypothetical protein BOTNAR_0001g00410 [Botryotinia narcissicola]|uniref:Uncharacterized protein n=1 Tax=Botryotinia narcissicola TaxID=278944 RepID=A0A4Z1J9S1_9HELO|nr:hypothetical protein BOTNAR_0001g00410 [Botryotinia narcissicola]